MNTGFYKLVLVISILLTLNLPLFGQSGIVAGPSLTWMNATVMEGTKYDLQNGMDGWGPKLFYHFGYKWEIPVKSFYNISISAIYEIKGAKTKPMELTHDDYDLENYNGEPIRIGQVMFETTQFSYLTLPVIINRHIGTFWKFGIGIEPSVILYSPIGGYNSKYFDLALCARVAYSKGRMEYSIKYTHGFLDVLDNLFIDKAYQRGLQFSVFYRIFDRRKEK